MQLRDYQLEDVEALMLKDSCGVFNEQRTGKTPTAIVTMMNKNVSRLLIVCPASLVYNWAEEYEAWSGNKPYIVASATKFSDNPPENLKELPCIITSYENLKGSNMYFGAADTLKDKYKPEGIIVDEAHRIKDRNSRAAKVVFRFKNIKYKLALTGTPAPNKQHEVWSILHFLYPKDFTSYWGFIDEWFVKKSIPTPRGFTDEPSHIRAHLVKPFQEMISNLAIMRKRVDVMPWLPKEEPPTRIRIPLTKLQEKYIYEMQEFFSTEHVDAQNTLVQLARMRQICTAPAILGLRGSSPKVDWVKAYLRDFPEKSVILFSNSRLLLELLHREVPKTLLYTGETSSANKHKIVHEFQENPGKVLLIQTEAGKEGLTLDRADVTIFLDTYPPAASYLQAKDRMVPVQEDRVKPKELIHVMMRDSYDEQLYDLVANNTAEIDVINHFTKYLRRN